MTQREEVVNLIARWLESPNRQVVGRLLREAANRIDGEDPSSVTAIKPGESQPYDRGEESFVMAVVALGASPDELLAEARFAPPKPTEPREMPFGATFGIAGPGSARTLRGGSYGQGKNRRH
jgi:hypothetical protein